MRFQPPVRLLALVITALLVLPTGYPGRSVAGSPTVTDTFVSTFVAPQPLPTGPLDQVVQVVNLEPGASTPIHSHEGPGFATVL